MGKLRSQETRLKRQGDRLPVVDAISWRVGKTTSERGYGAEWQREREAYLCANPLCVMCKALGLIVQATVVDHITPHRGDMRLFWLRTNWQSLCATCHSKYKQQQEARSY